MAKVCSDSDESYVDKDLINKDFDSIPPAGGIQVVEDGFSQD